MCPSSESAQDSPSEGQKEARDAALTHTHAWRVSWALYASCLIIFLIIFWDTAASAVRTWSQSDSYKHCFLIIPISVYLAWRRRATLTSLTPQPTLIGLALLLLLALLWKIGELSGTLVVQQFAFIGVTQALFIAIMGFGPSRALAFPFLYVYFAVPFGSFFIAPLQEFTAHTATRLLQLSGIPVHLNGFLIEIPGGSFHIAQACAGIRFLITSVAIGVLAAHLLLRSWPRRLIFVFLAILIPVLANGLRAFGIVLIAHLDSLAFARAIDHITFGLVFLGFVLALLMGIGWSLRDKSVTKKDLAAPCPLSSVGRRTAGTGKSIMVGAAALAALIAVHLTNLESDSGYAQSAISSMPVPTVSAPWTLQSDALLSWHPRINGSDLEMLERYSNGEQTVDFFAAYFRHQRQGAEVINQQNDLSGGLAWQLTPSSILDVPQADISIPFRTGSLVSTYGERILWYCYWVDGACTPHPLMAKLRQVKVGLLGGSPAALVIAISTPVYNTATDGVTILREFLMNLEPLNHWVKRFDPAPQSDISIPSNSSTIP